MDENLKYWEMSLNKRITAFNDELARVEGQLAQLAQAKVALEGFGEELMAEVSAYNRAKTQPKPQQAPPGTIPPLRPTQAKVPVNAPETIPEMPDAEDFFAEEPEEIQQTPQETQKPQHIVPTPHVSEPIKGGFDSKSLFAKMR